MGRDTRNPAEIYTIVAIRRARDGRWVILDLVSKHKRVRTVPMPTWKGQLDNHQRPATHGAESAVVDAQAQGTAPSAAHVRRNHGERIAAMLKARRFPWRQLVNPAPTSATPEAIGTARLAMADRIAAKRPRPDSGRGASAPLRPDMQRRGPS